MPGEGSYGKGKQRKRRMEPNPSAALGLAEELARKKLLRGAQQRAAGPARTR